MRGEWRVLVLLAGLTAGTGLAARPASATFHVMMVKEVFAGTPAAPAAQYVVLQAWDSGQNAVSGHGVRVYDAAGTLLETFSFTGSVSNSLDQMTILVATPEAAALLGLTADLAMTAVIPAAGGKVCWDAVDCVAWGTYGVAGDGAVGEPFNVDGGIPPCQAIRRRLEGGNPALLDAADDTDDSAGDFELTDAPFPQNNAGLPAAPPALACPGTVVTIAATVSPAAEAGLVAGTFRVTRSNTTGGDTVAYTVSGTATAGADYTALSGTVTFDPEADNADITVTPVDDPDAELTETVIVALEAGPGADYVPGAINRARVAITSDEPVPLIVTAPAGEPDPVPALGTVVFQVGVNPLVASPTFAWAASCPEGLTDGVFGDPSAPAPTWRAPRPPGRTGSVTCTISVTVGDGLGAGETASFEQTVNPRSGADRVPPLPAKGRSGAP